MCVNTLWEFDRYLDTHFCCPPHAITQQLCTNLTYFPSHEYHIMSTYTTQSNTINQQRWPSKINNFRDVVKQAMNWLIPAHPLSNNIGLNPGTLPVQVNTCVGDPIVMSLPLSNKALTCLSPAQLPVSKSLAAILTHTSPLFIGMTGVGRIVGLFERRPLCVHTIFIEMVTPGSVACYLIQRT